PLGATGVWLPTSSLLHARLNAAGVVAPDGAGGLRVYVVGGWGSCTGGANAVMGCAESATISADGATLGTFSEAGPASGAAGSFPARMRQGLASVSAANAEAGAADSFLVLAGGAGPAGGAVEYAPIASGVLGSWVQANASIPAARDGTQLAVI